MTTFSGRPNGPRARALALVASAAMAASLLTGLSPVGTAAASTDDKAAAGPAAPTAATAPVVRRRGGDARPAWEVWQVPQKPHPQNRSNPLTKRIWGVYEGPQDQAWAPYESARGKARRLIGKIALRPRTKWYGAFLGDGEVRGAVRDYIESSQDGDPRALVQMAIFRMQPWEHEACARPSTSHEKRSYRRWISNLAQGIGDTPTLIVMQPDGPFLWCAPDRRAKARLLTWATRTLSELPRTSVYIDAGAADWCENERAPLAERCAAILKHTGVRHARGFALDSTHYTGPIDNIRHGSRIVDILKRDGFGTKHFIIDTAKSGRPMRWNDVIPAIAGGLKDNARTCETRRMRQCVTLGIPPTTKVASRKWGMPRDVRRLAARNVDGFVWFGRPWLFNQADPFVRDRALDMGRSTPWPGPRYGSPKGS